MAGGDDKLEFPPLLSPGRHPMALAALNQLCVSNFPLSQRRAPLMNVVKDVLLSLSIEMIPAEVWIDGSFLTQKIEPDDVDLVVLLEAKNIPPDTNDSAWHVLERIGRKGFVTPLKCDSYLHFDFPEGHPKYLENEVKRAYWIRQFCFTRQVEMKGLAVVTTPLP